MNSVPNIASQTVAYTLVAATPVNIKVPQSSIYARFGSTGDFFACAGLNCPSAPVAPTPATPATLIASFTSPITGESSTGLPDESNVWDFYVTVSGGTQQHILVQGFVAQDYNALVSAINSQLQDATASVSGGALVIETDTAGASQSIDYVHGATDLFDALTDFSQLATENGTDEVVNQSPQLNPDIVRVIGQTHISIASPGTPTVSVTFFLPA